MVDTRTVVREIEGDAYVLNCAEVTVTLEIIWKAFENFVLAVKRNLREAHLLLSIKLWGLSIILWSVYLGDGIANL